MATDESILALCKKLGFKKPEKMFHENLLFGSGKELTDDDGLALAAYMEKYGPLKLRYIFLSENELTDVTAIALADALRNNLAPELEVIHFHRNKLTDKGVMAITSALTDTPHYYMREINVAENDGIGDDALISLVDMYKVMWEKPRCEEIPLTRLEWQGTLFNKHKITDTGVFALCDAMLNRDFWLNNIEELDLSDNEITDAGLSRIADCIAAGHMKKLKSLYLTWNKITDEGAEALANAILKCKKQPNLFDVRLDYMEVTDEGRSKIVEAGTERDCKISVILKHFD